MVKNGKGRRPNGQGRSPNFKGRMTEIAMAEGRISKAEMPNDEGRI